MTFISKVARQKRKEVPFPLHKFKTNCCLKIVPPGLLVCSEISTHLNFQNGGGIKHAIFPHAMINFILFFEPPPHP